jgi:phosphoribosyl 1,2-cyclic phosphate phosphodiesterase
MRLTVLGSGTSSGVPRIGGDWGDCDPANQRNRRRRVSVLIEHGPTTLIVDTSPDLREQLLDAGVARLDGVFFTHDHADHAHGIDDLRAVAHNMKRRVDCWANDATWDALKGRFGYIFDGSAGYPAFGTAHDLAAEHRFGDLTVRPFRQIHGMMDTAGFRFEAGGRAAAYSTDLNAIPLESEAYLEDLELWVVDALRRRPHPTHPHLKLTLEWIARFRPRRAIITHMDNTMDYDTLRAELPQGVEPGYDGLTVEL